MSRLGSCLEVPCLIMSHVSCLMSHDCVLTLSRVRHSYVLLLRWNTGVSCWRKATWPINSLFTYLL